MEQLLEQYAKGELGGDTCKKLEYWLETMERFKVSGGKFSLPDDERLYKLLTSTRSTFLDIEAFRPYSYESPSFFADPWVQCGASLLAIAAMIITTILMKTQL